MSALPPLTPPRGSSRRTRVLGSEEQLRECVEQLQHPELIASELKESRARVAHYLNEGGTAGPIRRADALAEPAASNPSAFYRSREISVIRDSSSFTCLEGAFDALCVAGGASAGDRPEGLGSAGVTRPAAPRPVLGVAQFSRDDSAYALLLRMLASLCEIAHASQIERLDALCFGGMLGACPNFDLHLVLWDDRLDEDGGVPERTPLNQLTHDLAEKVKAILLSRVESPALLGDILCLHMNPARFQGRLRFDWRV